MAKKIRFPLQMKDGTDVRTLEELREHFDLESVLGYFADGKLKTWLADRYYDEMAQKVNALSVDMPDLNAQLCGIIGVEYSELEDDTDFEALQRRQEKLRVLREVTDDQQILDNVDAVAFDQDELFDILDEAPAVIYLYGEKFSIPYAKGGITYIGVNNPMVSLEKNELEYKKNGILLQCIRFANKSDAVSVEVAKELIDQERYDEALPIVKQLAEEGNAVAQRYLGYMYDAGYGVKQNFVISADWYRKAAEHGDASAQLNLGAMYVDGEGVEQNYSLAFEWYKKAAEQGLKAAQKCLGAMYEDGLGVEQDYELAVEWYRKAAEQGYADAQKLLGDMYYNGRGVETNMEVAAEWYRKAAEKGNTKAQCKLGNLYDDGDGVTQDHAIAAEWYRKAAENGSAHGQFCLGLSYYIGEGVAQDYEQAFEWLQKAAKQGHLAAIVKLGVMYEEGLFVECDEEQAEKWYRKAAESEYDDAQFRLGLLYHSNGDYSEALSWYELAADQDHGGAQCNIGYMYEHGQGVYTNRNTALRYYKAAAENGNKVGAQNAFWLGGNSDGLVFNGMTYLSKDKYGTNEMFE